MREIEKFNNQESGPNFLIPEKPKDIENKQNSNNNKKKIIAAIFGVLVLLCICIVCVNRSFYKDKFYKGTMINGMDVSKLTVGEAQEKIKKEIENYKISIVGRNDIKDEILGKSIDFTVLPNDDISTIMKNQTFGGYMKSYFKNNSHDISGEFSYDKRKLWENIFSLNCMKKKNQLPPEDAEIIFEKGEFIIKEENFGSMVDPSLLFAKLNEAFSKQSQSLSLEESDVYLKPKVLKDSDLLENNLIELNEIAKAKVTLELPNNQEKVVDGGVIVRWLSKDNNGHYYLDENDLGESIKDFTNKLAKSIDTVGQERKFKATLQGEITVKGGTYGWRVDKKAESTQMRDDVLNKRDISREPIYSMREVSSENNGVGNTYIEIDLTNQKVWHYVDGKLYVNSSCVSGTGSLPERKTPGGLYKLQYREKNKTLKGKKLEDGTYEYEAPVSYWMPFNGGIGLHDAPWRGRFGGKIYVTSGSHGCINLPVSKAAAIYEKIDTNTPIVVYY